MISKDTILIILLGLSTALFFYSGFKSAKKGDITFSMFLFLIGFLMFTTTIFYSYNYQEELPPHGFFSGLRHGLTLVIALIVKIFSSSNPVIYSTANTGPSYDVGFLLGNFIFYSTVRISIVEFNFVSINLSKQK